MKTRSTRRLGALVGAVALTLAAAATATADDIIATSTDFIVVSNVNTIELYPGETATVTLSYSETNGPGTPPTNPGCDLTGPASQVTFNLLSTSPTVATVTPSPVQFTSCDDTEILTVTATSVGTTSITYGLSSITTNGGYTLNTVPANFVINVLAPVTVQRDAPAIANAYLHASEDNSDCKAAQGTNRNQANWHGNLITKVAQEFEGTTFTEQQVIDFVDGLCTR